MRASRHRLEPSGRIGFSGRAGLIVLCLALMPFAWAERTRLKPGWNMFSPQQDVEVGRAVAKDAEQKLPMLGDRRVDDYLGRLGQRLAVKAPGERYPYQFKAVNDPSINAFALPGGFLYIHRGTIEAADSEAQLAGVIGHEIAHVALRHGTNQASKAYAMQVPLAVLGGVVGSNSIAGVLTQIGAGFFAESVLLKYSRDAERQADLIGTQILYDNNYDPREMANFFEKLRAEGGSRGLQFFNSHPNPENRVEGVNGEIRKMGGPLGQYQNDSNEFREIGRYVRSLPAPPKAAAPATSRGTGTRGGGGTTRPQPPSGTTQVHQNNVLRMRYPDNWRSYGSGDAFTLAPEGGFVSDGRGNTSLAYGMMMSVFEAKADRSGRIDLDSATDQLIQSLQRANPDMQTNRQRSRARVGGQPAVSSMLMNVSPVGGSEVDWLVTVLRPEGLVYFVFAAPESDFSQYQRAFQDMLSSIQFAGR